MVFLFLFDGPSAPFLFSFELLKGFFFLVLLSRRGFSVRVGVFFDSFPGPDELCGLFAF